jgi:hypothetical protein
MGTCLSWSLVPPACDGLVDPAPEPSVAVHVQWLREPGYAAWGSSASSGGPPAILRLGGPSYA